MSRLINITQFILGFILGIAIIAVASAGAGYYYLSKIAVTPAKPTFTEEKEQPVAATEVQKEAPSEIISEPQPEPPLELEPELEPEPEPEPEPPLPPNAYKARVTWPQGLSLRAEPSINAARIGGIGFNAEIIILKKSNDQRWQKVRLPWNQQEGWVKSGNTKRVS